MLLTVDPDGTERVLVDPIALDPPGARRSTPGSRPRRAHLLAYQLSEGGTEESVLRVHGRRDRRASSTARSTGRATPPSPGCPAARRYFYVRRLRARAGAGGRGAVPPPGLAAPGRHRPGRRRRGASATGCDTTNYYGVSCRMRRPLAASSARPAGTAPRNDLWIADLPTSPLEAPDAAGRAGGRRRQTVAEVGRDGRLYVLTDRDAPRGRLARDRPDRPRRPSTGSTSCAEDDEAVLEDFAVLDGAELDDARSLLVAWTRHAVARGHRARPRDRRPARRTCRCPASASALGGLVERPEGGHEAWFGYTDHATPASVYRYDARTGETIAVGHARPGRSRCPRCTPGRSTYTSADGTPVRMFVLSPAHGAGPAAADGPLRLRRLQHPADARLLGAGARLGRGRRRLRGRQPARRRRGRRGVAPRRACASTSRTSSTTSTPPPSSCVATGWTTPRPARHLRRLQRRPAGRRGADPAPRPATPRSSARAPLLDMVRYEQFGLGATWNDEYGTADDPEELGWLLGYSPYHRVRRGHRLPGRRCSRCSTATPASTRCTPASCARRCSTRPAGTRPVLLRRERDVGHGARAVSRTVALTADTLGFAAHHTGLDLSADRRWRLPPAPLTVASTSSVPADPGGSPVLFAALTPCRPTSTRLPRLTSCVDDKRRGTLCDWVYDRDRQQVAWPSRRTGCSPSRRRSLSILVIALVVRFLVHRVIRRVARPGAAEGTVPGVLAAGHDGQAASATSLLSERRRQRAETMSSVLRSITTVVIVTVAFVMILDVARAADRAAARQRRRRRRRARLRRAEPGQGLPVRHLHDLRGPVRRRRRGRPRRGTVGTVEAVGLRVTRLRDVSGTVWYVRNGEILRVGNQSQNWSHRHRGHAGRLHRGPPPGAAGDRRGRRGLWPRTTTGRTKIIEEPTVGGVESITADVGHRPGRSSRPRRSSIGRCQRELRERIKEALRPRGHPSPAARGCAGIRRQSTASRHARHPRHHACGVLTRLRACFTWPSRGAAGGGGQAREASRVIVVPVSAWLTGQFALASSAAAAKSSAR